MKLFNELKLNVNLIKKKLFLKNIKITIPISDDYPMAYHNIVWFIKYKIV